MRCRVNLATEFVNPVVPQFVNNGISDINTLNENAGIWNHNTLIRRLPDVTHRSMAYHTVGQVPAVEDTVVDKSDYSEEDYNINFEI